MLEEVKKLHLWKGSLGEKLEKFKIIHKELNRITGKDIRLRINMDAFESANENSGASNWSDGTNTITMVGRLSVITLIHEWGHALGMGEEETSTWSNDLFKRSFPNSWGRLQNIGDSQDTMMVKPNQNPEGGRQRLQELFSALPQQQRTARTEEAILPEPNISVTPEPRTETKPRRRRKPTEERRVNV
jgi:hypothetical protein